MPWFYNSRTGAFAEEAGILGFFSTLQSHLGLGWHQYATKQQMLDAIKANHWPPPNNHPSNPIGKTIVGSVEAGSKVSLSGIGIHGDLRHFTLRAVEVLLGAVLIIVALESVMKETGAQNIVQGVKKYGKLVAK